ncbi:MAG: hypothetical protein JWO19_693 [Bryobacterales bacterium]|jgi:hypothetical protein|nr:hypothetical protein [Bryobacterales bacterium]
MLLPIQANQVKQDLEPLLGRKAEVVSAVRGISLGVAIEPADHTLHATILSSFPSTTPPNSLQSVVRL